MDTNCLEVTVHATHESLQMRLDEATRRGRHPRDTMAHIDAFVAATSRHLGAVEEVLVPEVAHLPEGKAEAHDYLRHARSLEEAVARLKARAYGELHAAPVPMRRVWDDVRGTLQRHNEAENRLVTWLTARSPHHAEALATGVYHAELRAPTRAHPHLPHTGLRGRAARRLWALADRFWDTAENRAVPPPIRPQRKVMDHESLMSQYLTGGPTLDPAAPLVTHRPSYRRRTAK